MINWWQVAACGGAALVMGFVGVMAGLISSAIIVNRRMTKDADGYWKEQKREPLGKVVK